MSTGIRGDFSHLRDLERAFGALAATGREESIKVAAAAALAQVQLGFARAVDPDDKPWLPLKYRKGQPLRKTGVLANSFTAAPSGPDSFTIGSNVPYAPPHQFGATITRKARNQVLAFGSHGFRSRASTAKLKRSVKIRFAFIPGGTFTIPARPMLPTGGVLPPRWQRAISRGVAGVISRHLKASP